MNDDVVPVDVLMRSRGEAGAKQAATDKSPFYIP